MTGEAAGGTEGGAGEGRPVGCGGTSFCGPLAGAAAFTMGPVDKNVIRNGIKPENMTAVQVLK